VSDALVTMAGRHRLVVTVEDGGGHGGIGSAVAAALRAAELDVPLRDLALPQRFFEHRQPGRRARLGRADRAGRGPPRHRVDRRAARRVRRAGADQDSDAESLGRPPRD